MTNEQIHALLEKQRAFYLTNVTLDVKYRIQNLKKLYQVILKYEDQINEALQKDLGKNPTESYMSEIGMVLSEISYMLKHVKKYSRRKIVPSPLAQFCSVSYKQAIPYGNTLIISPWNYPFLLTIEPLVDAIASGNTAIVKPSAYSKYTSNIIKKMIEECFEEDYVAVVLGGREENQALLNQKFDFIFFTGSTTVGKEVMLKASKNLTPVVLELGGKSPCIVDESADLKLSARRIVFGKFLNCGQTCVAPDYILVKDSIKEELIKAIISEINHQYGNLPLENHLYGKIINQKHYNRLLNLIDQNKIVYGGSYNDQSMQIEPSIMDEVTFEDKVMLEEIFGPILPIITYNSFDEMINMLKTKAKPLALYIFSKNKKHIHTVSKELTYGGGCINDCIIHLASSYMGFGGVGESGMGSYHGKDGFDAFSHTKSIVDKKLWLDLPMRYQPHINKIYQKLLRIFLS